MELFLIEGKKTTKLELCINGTPIHVHVAVK